MDTYENQPQPEQQPQQREALPQFEVPGQVQNPTPVYQPYYQYPPVQPPAPQPETKKSGNAWKVILSIAVVVSIVISCCYFTAASINGYWQTETERMNQEFNQKITQLRKEFEDKTYAGSGNSVSGTPNVTPDGSLTPAQVYAQHADSVVAIKVTLNRGTSSGSGFIITTDGYIVTNYHVVEGARKIAVTDAYGETYTASYVGGDEANDIAVIKVEADNLQAAVIGSSNLLIVGDQVVAIGNPLGTLASTLTVGYVSAKDRMVNTDGSYINMIQTDAAINPGNSGGPLFNMKGEVVGITSAKYSGLTSSGATIEGIGFAIPMDDVADMINDIMDKGYASEADMGISVDNVSAQAAQAYGIPVGALVTEVDRGGAAEKAGMQVQDIIVELGGYSVTNTNDLSRALRSFKPGQTVTVKVFRYRSGGEMTLTITLDEAPSANSGSNQGSMDNWYDHFFG